MFVSVQLNTSNCYILIYFVINFINLKLLIFIGTESHTRIIYYANFYYDFVNISIFLTLIIKLFMGSHEMISSQPINTDGT